ncbi:MAG: S28 family serine protease [Rikenellaceae bacterium]|nr:S28 family serine protease [Rikenellaceae bacterium]
MKTTLRQIAILFIVTGSVLCTSVQQNYAQNTCDTLKETISSLSGVSRVERLRTDKFKDKYVLFVEQPLDHKNPTAGTFLQRVFVMNVGKDRPTVIVTEGYGAAYASMPHYREELSRFFDANIIFVEHRYFLESTPKPLDWKYLTAENSAWDLHRVTKLFKTIYKGKWIATGISKGGQTALIYRAFFPEDVDITVPYVAPLCKSREDGRHEPFISNFAGTKEQRAAVLDFQKRILEKRATLQPKFDSLCMANKYKFNLPLENIYDYTVLEFSFSFWQWGSPVSGIPGADASDDQLFKYWIRMCSPDYFVNNSPTAAFFVQAARELGYYGYDVKPFKGLLTIKNTKGYLSALFLPEGSEYKFDNSLYKKLKKFVATTDKKMLFIYGEFDPWSSVKVDEPKNDNVVVLVQPEGSHRARISNMPDSLKNEAIEIIKRWLSE